MCSSMQIQPQYNVRVSLTNSVDARQKHEKRFAPAPMDADADSAEAAIAMPPALPARPRAEPEGMACAVDDLGRVHTAGIAQAAHVCTSKLLHPVAACNPAKTCIG